MNRTLLLCLAGLLLVSACGGGGSEEAGPDGADPSASTSAPDSPEPVAMPEDPLCAEVDPQTIADALGGGELEIARDDRAGAHVFGKKGPRLKGPMCEVNLGATNAAFQVTPAPKGMAGVRRAAKASQAGLTGAGATCTALAARQVSDRRAVLSTCDYNDSAIGEVVVLVDDWSLSCSVFNVPDKQAATRAVTGMCELMLDQLDA